MASIDALEKCAADGLSPATTLRAIDRKSAGGQVLSRDREFTLQPIELDRILLRHCAPDILQVHW